MTTHSHGERPKHLNAQLEGDFQALKERVRFMGQVVDRQVTYATAALAQRDLAAADLVIGGDSQVNELEREIDARCVRALALFQPAASDLRFVAAVLKIVTDLERIGDFAVSIAKSVASVGVNRLRSEIELPAMTEAALCVLRGALDAFLLRNGAEAERASKADAQVTALTLKLAQEVRDEIHRDPRVLETGIAVLFVSKYIERIAEHAANVAEMALYTERGEDVRHVTTR